MKSQDITNAVRRRLADIPERTSMADDELRRLVSLEVEEVLRNSDVPVGDERDALRRVVVNELLGFGPLQDLLDDPGVSEIMVNGFKEIWVERAGVIELTDRSFESEDQLLVVIDRMVRSSGRRVDQSSPMVDARLPDGSRLNVILPPLAVDGPAVTVRKFTSAGLTSDDLVASSTLSPEAAEFLGDAVASRMNILVSGGTGTGKTTVLNILSTFIDRDERVVTIEDAVELTLRLPNLVRLEARPGNSEGAGEVNVRELVRNSLRMRPNRIIVGEVRSGETIDMLQAMNTGHEGSLSTVHANSARDALRRVETMVMLGGTDLPLRAIREQVANSIDILVHLVRDPLGRRFVSQITEVVGMEGDTISTSDLFSRSTYPSGTQRTLPELVSTGLQSSRLGARHVALT